MENLREIINNFQEEDFKDKVNLHIHTFYSDGLADPEEIIKSAKEKGYKLIAITDHNTAEAHNIIQDKILLTGAEFDCWFGYVFIHLLAYGIDINHPDLQPFLAKDKKGTEDVIPRLFAKRNVKKLISAIHNADGIEVYYPYPRFRKFAKFHSADAVKKIADKYPKLLKTGGTDFHGEKF